MKTYGKMKLTPRGWEITRLLPHVCIKLKALFKQIPKGKPVPFRLDNTPERCKDILWFTSRYPLQISDLDRSALTEGAGAFDKTLEALEAIQKPDYLAHIFDLKLPLRPYQAAGVETALTTKRLLIGDVVGLGKTAQGIGLCVNPGVTPTAIVVQTHLPQQWKEQIDKFSDLKVHVIKGTKPYSLPAADIYIFKYSCLSGWVDTFKMGIFNSVIFDEVQELRTGVSAKCTAARKLSESVEYVLGLSATPIYNFGNEVFNIFDIIKPGSLGDWNDFQREWVGWGGKKVNDPAALGAYLRENFLMIRRSREETGRQLESVNTVVHTVGYDEAAVHAMQVLAKQLATKVTTGTFVERGQAARELDIMVRQTTGVSKAKYVAEYVRALLENGEPVLLAGWHRECYQIWNDELRDFNPVMYTGSESPAQKEKAKRDFISGKSNLMFISLRSGVGLDGLQERGKIVVFGELDWSGAIHEQVIGRLRRDGQNDQVTAIYLVSDSGSDPLMQDLLGLKGSQQAGILDPDKTGVEFIQTDENRIKLLAQRVLEMK